MELGAEFVEKSILNIKHLQTSIIAFKNFLFTSLMSLILPKFHNHVFISTLL